jgi:hypothetical protein
MNPLNGRLIGMCECIRETLEEVSPGVVWKEPFGWEVTFGEHPQLVVRASVAESFLTFDIPLSDRRYGRPITPELLWHLLSSNSRLPAWVRFALTAGSQSVHLGAEIPFADDQTILSKRIRLIGEALRQALELYQSKHVAPDNLSGKPVGTNTELLKLCAEAGWPVQERAGSTVVPLETSSDFQSAKICEEAERGIVAFVELCSGKVKKTSRTALALLLLNACRHVRLIRASAVGGQGSEFSARFEVVFDETAGVGDLTHGFSALSLACNRFGKEVRALRDEELARSHLLQQGGPS